MKKLFVVLAFSVALIACGGDKPADNSAATQKKDSVAPAVEQNQYETGMNLVATSDCTTCHKINEKVTGPAYIDVSKKYEPTEANIDSLAGKVIKGGAGVWGTTMMTPHPTLPLDSAREMVKYILSLKNQQ